MQWVLSMTGIKSDNIKWLSFSDCVTGLGNPLGVSSRQPVIVCYVIARHGYRPR